MFDMNVFLCNKMIRLDECTNCDFIYEAKKYCHSFETDYRVEIYGIQSNQTNGVFSLSKHVQSTFNLSYIIIKILVTS
jgi:hypothetical protein